MKKTLLSLAALLMATASFAQTFNGDETYYKQEMFTGGTSCIAGAYQGGILARNGGPNGATNIASDVLSSTDGSLEITSSATINGESATNLYWWAFVYTRPSDNACATMNTLAGVDMTGTNGSRMKIRAKASQNGAQMRVFIGYTGTGSYFPSNSTANINDGTFGNIPWVVTLTDSYQEYSFDFTALPADAAVWTAWTGKDLVNSYTFDPRTANVTYNIDVIEIGDQVTLSNQASVDNNAISIAPNPASDFVKVSFNGMESNGAVAKLINANGIVVFEGALTNESLSLAGYNKGIYMLQVVSGNKIATQKVVVQ